MKRLPRRLRYGEEATLVEHLDELRTRLIVSLVALALGFVVAFVFHERLVRWLEDALPQSRQHLITLGVGEPFITSMWVSFYAGFLLALPVILWQLWGFLAPAVDDRHQHQVGVFVGLATLLLAGGLAFGYWVGLPKSLSFLTNYDSDLYNVQIRARDYLSFATGVLVAFAIVFELPIFILALVRLRILSTSTLRRQRRIGYFIVACVAVALPGIDPITTTIEAVPLLVLFEGSIWLSYLVERRAKAASAVETATDSY